MAPKCSRRHRYEYSRAGIFTGVDKQRVFFLWNTHIEQYQRSMARPLCGRNGARHGAGMSLDQLRTVVAIADEGTMTAAAEKLHISQPPLSRQLKDLEDELGTRLFERRPRGMHLMPAGETFVAHARQILAAIDAAVVAVRQPASSSTALRDAAAHTFPA